MLWSGLCLACGLASVSGCCGLACAWPVVWLLAWVLCLVCGLASVSGAVLGLWSGLCLACGLAFGLGAVSGLWFGSVLGLCVRIGLGRGDYGAVGCSVEWMRDWPLMRDWLQYAISRTRKITAR